VEIKIIVQKYIVSTLLTSSLFADYQINYHNVNIETSQFDYRKKLPIHFISTNKNGVNQQNKVKFQKRKIPKQYGYDYQESDEIRKFDDSLTMEVGAKFLKDMFLEVSNELPNISINRDIEFYNEEFITPYLRLTFRDVDLSRNGYFIMRNSAELNYFQYDKQTPFFSESKNFPSNKTYNVNTEINSLSLFWKGSFLFKASFLSAGGYIGAGLNVLNGSALYIRYPSELNSSFIQNVAYFNQGEILEKGEIIKMEFTTSAIFKYGASINIDFKPIHLSAGIDFSLTNESHLYWIERNYFLELGYLF